MTELFQRTNGNCLAHGVYPCRACMATQLENDRRADWEEDAPKRHAAEVRLVMQKRIRLREELKAWPGRAQQIAREDGYLRTELHDLKQARWKRAQDAAQFGNRKRYEWMRRAWDAKWGGTLFDHRPMQRTLKDAYARILDGER